MDLDTKLKRLNPAQLEAVNTIDGPVLVLAGPGSGKTELLSVRVANILKRTDAAAGNILCLTFTEAAAATMRQRLVDLIGEPAYRVGGYTFHGFGNLVRERHFEYFSEHAGFEPVDEVMQRQTLNEILEELPRRHPLGVKRANKGFVYLGELIKNIEALKKATITPDVFNNILKENSKSYAKINDILTQYFGERLTKKRLPVMAGAVEDLEKVGSSLAKALASYLREALTAAETLATTEPVAKFRTRFVQKSETGQYVLKESADREKLEGLAQIYGQYTKTLTSAGYYDYNDMIMDLVRALKSQPGLRAELEEQYQYILVDEFQDTNDAQFQILQLLTSSHVHEGRPNIMVVGDDDQAIYKFQGADNSNIQRFLKLYKNPKVVALNKNYRSTQGILNLATLLIDQSELRQSAGFKKALEAAKASHPAEEIALPVFRTPAHERSWLINDLKKRIAAGSEPTEIAVIARTNKELANLGLALRAAGVAYKYERQHNVLKEPHIRALVIICRFLHLQGQSQGSRGEELLPEILSYPFWQLPRLAVWEIALKAHETRQSWLKVMRSMTDQKVKGVAEFLIDLASRAPALPAEHVLHELMTKGHKVCGFYDYYFSKLSQAERGEELMFLSALKAFVTALREHKRGQPLPLKGLLEFVDLHESAELELTDKTSFQTGLKPINLLTAHGAKGQEFAVVYVIHGQQNIWAKGAMGAKLKLPANLAIEPAGDNWDDQLRLFFVAVTRAKHTLLISSHEEDEKGRKSLRLQCLAPQLGQLLETAHAAGLKHQAPADEQVLDFTLEELKPRPFEANEKQILKELVEKYQLSATGLVNYLDLAEGRGPEYFLSKNLLHFPEPQTASAAYGTAFHRAVAFVTRFAKTNEALPKLSLVISEFEKILTLARLASRDFERELERGQEVLPQFIRHYAPDFLGDHQSEVNFKNEGVVVAGLPAGRQGLGLTGKIDRLEIVDGEIIVTDFKTRQATKDPIKLWQYKLQLAFYKLLIESSQSYERQKVSRGIIEFAEPVKSNFERVEIEITEAEVARLKRIITGVARRLQALDFSNPNIKGETVKANLEFEESLLGLS